MARLAAALLTGALAAGCGYTTGLAGAPLSVQLEAVGEAGPDLDAGALVERALRRAIARRPGLRLAHGPPASLTLEVALLEASAALDPASEPELRAPRYVARVVLGGRQRGPGAVARELPPALGEAAFLGTPGRIEALDGARRLALERAAEAAADALAAGLVVALAGAPAPAPAGR